MGCSLYQLEQAAQLLLARRPVEWRFDVHARGPKVCGALVQVHLRCLELYCLIAFAIC